MLPPRSPASGGQLLKLLLQLTLMPASLADAPTSFERACAARLAPICRALRFRRPPRPRVRCCSVCQAAHEPTLRLELTLAATAQVDAREQALRATFCGAPGDEDFDGA